MEKNYDKIIQGRADHVFEVMTRRVSVEEWHKSRRHLNWPDFGRWPEVHISSERLTRQSQLGCVD